MRNASLWRALLCVENTVVEDVEFDDEAQVLVAHVRPRRASRGRCGTCADPTDGALPRDLLLDGLALIFTDGAPAAAPTLRRAIAALRVSEASVEEVLRWGWLAARAAIWLWDYDSGLEIPRRAVQLARDSGALEVLAVADNVCGQAAAWGGDFELAALMAAEVEAVKEATGAVSARTP